MPLLPEIIATRLYGPLRYPSGNASAEAPSRNFILPAEPGHLLPHPAPFSTRRAGLSFCRSFRLATKKGPPTVLLSWRVCGVLFLLTERRRKEARQPSCVRKYYGLKVGWNSQDDATLEEAVSNVGPPVCRASILASLPSSFLHSHWHCPS